MRRPAGRWTAGSPRRSRIRRASAGFSPLRAGALLVMLLCIGAIYGVAGTSVFGYVGMNLDGARFTSETAVSDALRVDRGTNVVTLRTDALAAAIRILPTVRDATVSVALPGTLQVHLAEREPIFIWTTAGGRFLVDRDGVLFASADAAPASATAGLRSVTDARSTAAVLAVGASLDPVVLDAARRLGSLTPADVGSAAPSLALTIDDTDGFVLSSGPTGWSATFGFYTPTLRIPDIIPGQVRFLRSLLGRIAESRIARIVLADPTSGTYTLKNGQ
ncbi:MAG: cell division protein FtsQ/DivIB [Candidatus Limnocylindrales bacterium]